jgi:hypothetical protein
VEELRRGNKEYAVSAIKDTSQDVGGEGKEGWERDGNAIFRGEKARNTCTLST